jgi:indole-3-glycerol phosphate synthase/phosphoribosylanthranilate isomerase
MPNIVETGADRVLLDTASKTRRGGTGRRFDWSLITELPLDTVILSGGLDPASAEAADLLGPSLLDINSGVERAPGIKDEMKIRDFFQALRG